MKWHHPESSRLMAEQGRAGSDSEKQLRSPKLGKHILINQSEIRAQQYSSWLGMSCFPGVIYLLDAVSLIKRANHDSL